MSAAIEYDGGLTLAIPVSDLDNAIEWYRKILGFELLYRLDEMDWCELKSSVNGVNVGLSAVEKPSPGGATPTFGVRDIEAAKKSLQDRDVRIDGEIMTIEGMVRLLTFYDADNNALMFFEDISPNE